METKSENKKIQTPKQKQEQKVMPQMIVGEPITIKLMKVQSALKAPKNQFNNFGKYKYRSCEDILEALKPLLLENELTLVVSDEITQIGDRFYVKATASVSNSMGHMITTYAYAREPLNKKGMDESQITGATSSYARKYALNGLFCIDDNRDADSQDNRQESKPVSKEPKPEEVLMKKITDLAQKLFKKPDDFKLFRVDSGLAESLSKAQFTELEDILEALELKQKVDQTLDQKDEANEE